MTECARMSPSSSAGTRLTITPNSEQPLRASEARATRTAEAMPGTEEPLITTRTGLPSWLASDALSSKSSAGSTPAKSVPSQTITSNRRSSRLYASNTRCSSSACEPAAIIECASSADTRVHLLIGARQPVAVADQLDLGVGPVAGRDDRAKEAGALRLAGERLHQAERDNRLAAARFHRGDVEIARHARAFILVGGAGRVKRENRERRN